MANAPGIEHGGSRLPLAWRIFLLCAALVLLAVAAATAATWFVGQRIAAGAVAEALEKSAEAQSSQTQQRLRLLERTLLLLGRDPALVNYVATALSGDELGLGESGGGDTTSIRDLLIERREQFGFDLGLVIDPEGALLARSDETEAFEMDFTADPLVASARERTAPQSGFWRLGDALYQAAIVPLAQDDTLVGYLLLAQRVDGALARDIARASEAEIAFWLPAADGPLLTASSLPEASAEALRTALMTRTDVGEALRLGQPIDRLDLDFGGQHWLAHLRPTAVEGETALGAVTSLASGEAVASGYRQILDRVLLAGLASLAIALPLSFWLSRRILRPVRLLTGAAEEAAAGNYQAQVAIGGNDELARLGRAFDTLLSDLREKRDIEGYVANFSRFLPEAGEDAEPERVPARPPLPAPRRFSGTLLGVEFAPSESTTGDPGERAAVLERLARDLAAVASGCEGQVLAGGGQRWVLGFEGPAARVRALQASAALLGEVQADGFRTPGLALLDGEAVHAVVAAGDREFSAVLGAAGFQLDRLLGEAGPGRALLTRATGDAIKQAQGTEVLGVAEGAQSGKKFYALHVPALAAMSFPEPRPAEPSAQATRVAPAASEPGELRIGSRLGGRYEILTLLGEGGMGVVYKARDLELRDIVALKMLKPGALQDREQLERLKDEIRLARKITHPNVLRTFDFGEIGGSPFISMEYVRGVTLRGLLSESGRLPYSAGLRIARQFCAGLAAAHEVGVLHRDIKPENVILEAGGNAKLMDFGIARPIRRAAESGHTQPGMYLGTPTYSPPEQLRGEDLDARADIYATGVMLQELFCGGVPYGGDTTMEIYRQQLQEEPRRPSMHWPGVPPALEEIILRCIARERAARYQHVGELAADLAQLRA